MPTSSPAFKAWLDDFLASYFRHRPVNATFIGMHDYDARLPDYSEKGTSAATGDLRSLASRLAVLPPEPLTRHEVMDRTLAEGFLQIQQWEFDSHHFQSGNPSTYTGEAIFGAISLFLRPFAPIAPRLDSAIARMEAIPAFLQQGQRNVREAPGAWTERALRECTGALAFLSNGIDILTQEHGITNPHFRAAAEKAAHAFGEFQHYLEVELRGHPTDGYACGPAALDLLIRKGHFLASSATEIETYAQDQLAESRAYLEAHARDFGASTPREALARLGDLHPTIDQYYARYSEVWQACRQVAEANRLVTWPEYPLRYVPQPRWARRAAPYLYFLFYRAPAPYDHLPLIEYLVTPIDPDMPPADQERLLRATNDSSIKLNHVVHHGSIGHHIQNWHANRAASRIGQIAAADCASRIAMFCAGTMAEGWAVYATSLMSEVGFLTPLEQYSEYQGRMRQAARAIVDINLHSSVFTFDEAVAFYRDGAGMAPEAARSETVKNSMFPGAALMYLIGADLIHELRTKMKSAQGAAFDLQHFHDSFLSYGSVPVSLVAASMRGELANAQ